MRFMRVFVLSLLVTLGVSASAVLAQPDTSFVQDSVFVVPKVPISAEAEDATQAQRLARNQGRREALDILLRRLTAEQDWVYLPRLAISQPALAGGQRVYPVEPDGGNGGGAASIPDLLPGERGRGDNDNTQGYDQGGYRGFAGKQAVMIDPKNLSLFEESFAVFEEKSSAKSYSAEVTYRFKPGEIRALLKNAGIPYSESQTRTALVVPVLETKNGLYLWESNNPWARAWLARPLNNELTPMRLPLGDRRDVETITPLQARAFDQRRLGALAARYGVTQVIIAHGFLSESDGQYRLRVRLMNGYLNNKARAARDYVPTNTAILYDNEDGFGAPGVDNFGSGEPSGSVLAQSWYREPVGDFPMLARRAVESAVAKYAAGWKAQTLIDHSASRTYKVNAWVSGINELAAIRKALEGSPLVADVSIDAIAPEGATIFIKVIGDIDQLVTELRQRNLVFWTTDNITWNIASPDTAQTIQSRLGAYGPGGLDNLLGPSKALGNGDSGPGLGLIYGNDNKRPSADISPPSARELGQPEEVTEEDELEGLF